MSISADTWDAAVEAMRTAMPEQMRGVDRLLDAPA
jgi:hypothetical protein